MKSFLKTLHAIEVSFLVYSFLFSTFLVFAQVVMRYVFSYSLPWSEELSRYIYLWQIWIGASYAVAEGRHLRISMILDKLTIATRSKLEISVYIVWLGFSIYLVITGMDVVQKIFASGQLSPALRMPMAYAYASVPIGAAMMSIHLIALMKDMWPTRREVE